MKGIWIPARTIVGAMLLATAATSAAELPPREMMAKDGWTIEFSPVDRPTAEKLAARAGELEHARSAAVGLNFELSPAALGTRSAELAQRLSDLCALPDRRADFQAEVARLAVGLGGLEGEIAAAVFPRSIAIWRKSELIQRLGAGEKIAGFSYHAAGNDVSFDFNPHWTMDKNHAVTEHPEPIGVLPVKQPEDVVVTDAAIATMMNDFQGLCGALGGTMTLGLRVQTFGGIETGVRKILETESTADPSAKWISVGVARWVARQALVQTTSPQVADRYTVLADRTLQAAMQKPDPIDLEAWPAAQESHHYAAANQIFRNIAEKHSLAAVTRLLAEFWKLPPAQRTSAEFRQLYRHLFQESLEAEVPVGVRFGSG